MVVALALMATVSVAGIPVASASTALVNLKMEVSNPCVVTGCHLTVFVRGSDPTVLPTGTIEFTEDSSAGVLHNTTGGLCGDLPLVPRTKESATATCLAFVPPGIDAIGAIYSGDVNYSGTSSQAFIHEQLVKIHTVTVTGSVDAPTITIHGVDFGSAPTWAANSAGCGATGKNFGTTWWLGDPLYLKDTSANWSAGEPNDCIGLVLSSYTSHQIVFSFGNYYDKTGAKVPVLLSDGATFSVTVFGGTKSAIVKY